MSARRGWMGLAILTGCAGAMDDSDARIAAAQTASPDAALARCAPAEPEPEEAPLLPFRDEQELMRALEGSSWYANARVDGWPLPTLAAGEPAGPQASADPGARASAAEPTQIFFTETGIGVDVGVPGAPRPIPRAGSEGLTTVSIPQGDTLREGAFVYTIESVAFAGGARSDRDDDAAWQATAGAPYGRPAPLPRDGGVRIAGHVVRDGALVALDSTYIQASLPSFGEVSVVDGALVFTLDSAPRVDLVRDAARGCLRGRPLMPGLFRRRVGSDRLEPLGPLLAATDVRRPAPQLPDFTPLRDPTLSALVRCKPDAGGALHCAAQAHFGRGAAHLLTTHDRMYTQDGTRIYAWGLANGALSVHRYQTSPRYDRRKVQAAERDGALHVAVTLANPSRVAMESLPLTAFDRRGMQGTSPRVLAEAGGSARPVLSERFVGTTYAASFGGYGTGASTLVLYDVQARAEPLVTTGDSPYVHISPLGPDRALLVAQGGKLAARRGLTLEVWTLGARPVARSALALPEHEAGAMVAAYRARADGAAVLGLSMHTLPPPASSVGDARVGFFALTPDHAITPLGFVTPGDVAPAGGAAERCVGAAQPLFLGARSFAILCDVVQELTIDEGVRTLGAPLRLSRSSR